LVQACRLGLYRPRSKSGQPHQKLFLIWIVAFENEHVIGWGCVPKIKEAQEYFITLQRIRSCIITKSKFLPDVSVPGMRCHYEETRIPYALLIYDEEAQRKENTERFLKLFGLWEEKDVAAGSFSKGRKY
jgi:hypothetical protein